MKHICGEEGCKWVSDEEYARIMLERAVKEKQKQDSKEALRKKKEKITKK